MTKKTLNIINDAIIKSITPSFIEIQAFKNKQTEIKINT